MNKNILLLTLICGIIFACGQSNDKLIPVELQCEYQTEPVGIDVPAPRFGWQTFDSKHVRGQMQTAYHILVASCPDKLTEAEADVWNSGKINSSQSVLAPFGGKKLQSSSAYVWKVRIYDKDGNPSEWSEPARFVTGILDSKEWNEAEWIRHPDAPRVKHIWFRKNLTLDAKPGAVFIHLASLGHHELYVNGQKADDRVLAPALTNLNKRLFYVTYDISKLLKKGNNTVGVWYASGWASYYCFSQTPALRVRLDGKDADGKSLTLVSDATWRCVVSNSEDTRQIRTHHDNGGEIVDARSFVPNWNSPSLDDSKWEYAAIAIGNDSIALEAHDIDPSRVIDVLSAQKITDAGNGVYKIDFGKNFTGWLNIKFNGLSAGDTVVIGSADDDKDFADFNIYNVFVSSGKDGETFSNRFNYVAGRYANIKGLRQAPKLEDATACAVSTDLRRTGKFNSSNELFNKIFETDLWTFLANTTEGYTSDCPHRERCGYGEVATATSWGIGLPNYDAGSFYRNVVRNWRDVQNPDGWGRHTAPQPNDVHWGGAMWSSAGMNVAWEHYLHFGDKQILELIYPTAVRWLEFLNAHVSEGLLRKYRDNDGQFLGDWLAPGSRNEYGTSPQAVYFNNCVYAMNLETFVKIANLLGKSGDAALYGERLAALRPAIHAEFYDPNTGNYCDGNQVQQAFAVITGVALDSIRTRAEASIVNNMRNEKQYFDMGSSGLVVLLHYLVDRPETAGLAASILNRTEFPGYGYFIAQGESTWPEDWKIDVPSKIHTCFTGIAGWLSKGLCGIQPDEKNAGYKHFIVKPFIVNEVNFAEASVGSPYGEILSRWERKDDKIIFSVTVPPNTSATVYIPASHPDRITENGNPLNVAEGVNSKGAETGYVVVEVISGKYEFAAANEN
ncbi:MAG: glycoside hydrolase family 78 protein [Prevotellaceae bacterium]|jgi:alpha-L-rhamnosidase|nr:glycoside hydrolase family 78 protein [Prevotellaceae bacterium]